MTRETGPIVDDTGRIPIKSWTRGVPVDQGAIDQARNLTRLDFVKRHVALMSDVHRGIGAVVGSVIATQGAIIPAAVGVDIGCGMMAVQTLLPASKLPDSLQAIYDGLERAIPVGGPGRKGSWHEDGRHGCPGSVATAWTHFSQEYEELTKIHPKIKSGMSIEQLGTLGTGNHFIEICLDEYDTVWVMLHSGSRGIGNRIGTYFIEKAKEEMRLYHINLPDKDLSYLPQGTRYFSEYIKAVNFAQRFALANRELMMKRVLEVLREHVPPFQLGGVAVNCHHNYVRMENHFGENVWLTRKGAVRAGTGDWGIIPGSMGRKSYIVRGKGNPDSFESCSHGAGRVMSRNQAREVITLADHERETQGVVCRKDAGVLDESPQAYKDIDAVMAAQSDLVEIMYTLKQIVCLKG